LASGQVVIAWEFTDAVETLLVGMMVMVSEINLFLSRSTVEPREREKCYWIRKKKNNLTRFYSPLAELEMHTFLSL